MTMLFLRRDKEDAGVLDYAKDVVKGIPHIFTEGIPGLAYWLKGLVSKGPDLAERIAEETPKAYWTSLNKKLGWSGIPKLNEGTNPFDGLQHGGLAQQKRQSLTPFGSKYDSFRALAKSMGETFEQLTSRKGFAGQLMRGRRVQALGYGEFGGAELFETAIAGAEGPELVRYVKKTVDPERAGDWVKREARREAMKLFPEEGGTGRLIREVAEGFEERLAFVKDIRSEAKALGRLSRIETETVPSLYHANIGSNTLFMEHMPGSTIAEIARVKAGSGGFTEGLAEAARITESAVQRDISLVGKAGVTNLDIHAGNIMFDPVTGRASWIDFGMGKTSTTIKTEQGVKQMSESLTSIMGEVSEVVARRRQQVSAATGLPSHLEKTQLMAAEQLRRDQEKLWYNAHNGGQNHVRSRSIRSRSSAPTGKGLV